MFRAEGRVIAERVSREPARVPQTRDHLLRHRPEAAHRLLLVPRVGNPRQHRAAEHQRGAAVRRRATRRRQRVRAGQPQHRRRGETAVPTTTRHALQVSENNRIAPRVLGAQGQK